MKVFAYTDHARAKLFHQDFLAKLSRLECGEVPGKANGDGEFNPKLLKDIELAFRRSDDAVGFVADDLPGVPLEGEDYRSYSPDFRLTYALSDNRLMPAVYSIEHANCHYRFAGMLSIIFSMLEQLHFPQFQEPMASTLLLAWQRFLARPLLGEYRKWPVACQRCRERGRCIVVSLGLQRGHRKPTRVVAVYPDQPQLPPLPLLGPKAFPPSLSLRSISISLYQFQLSPACLNLSPVQC